MDYIAFLQDAIRDLHGCESTHLETVPVTERFQGKTVWQGAVEVFHVPEHPKTDKVFAWAHSDEGLPDDLKAITVLSVPPVMTPKKAVQAYIASEVRRERDNANQEA
jgi:hypothetical protein